MFMHNQDTEGNLICPSKEDTLMTPMNDILEEIYGPWVDEYTRVVLLCYFWPSFLMGNIDSMLPEEILKLSQA